MGTRVEDGPPGRQRTTVVVRNPDEPRLDGLVQALLARLRACDVAMPIRASCLGSTPADRVVLGRRPMPVLVLDQAGCMLGAAGPRQLAAAAGLHRVVADAMTPANRLALISGADPALVLAGPLTRDGFAIVRWRGRLLAAEIDDLRCQARIHQMLSDWGRARFG
jgi:hypothetical protein